MPWRKNPSIVVVYGCGFDYEQPTWPDPLPQAKPVTYPTTVSGTNVTIAPPLEQQILDELRAIRGALQAMLEALKPTRKPRAKRSK